MRRQAKIGNLMTMMNEADFWRIIDTSRDRARETELGPGVDFMNVHEKTLAEALVARRYPRHVARFPDMGD